MAIQRILYKGKKELTMAEYEALTSEDSAIDYDITDYPQESITNSEMTYALTCKKLFPEGTVKICSDNGAYTQGKLYQIVVSGGVKSWKDITSSSSSISLNYSEFKSDETSGDMWLGNGQNTISMAQMVTSDGTNTQGVVAIDKSGPTIIGYSSSTETESYGSRQTFSNVITLENLHQINGVAKSTKILVSEDNTTIQSINGDTTKTIKITSTGATIDDKEIMTSGDLDGYVKNSGEKTISGKTKFTNGLNEVVRINSTDTGIGVGFGETGLIDTTTVPAMNVYSDAETHVTLKFPTTKGGTFALVEDLNNYLPLSGGSLTGKLILPNTTNTGEHAFAEGNNTIASGGSSHAEGANSEASGAGSHAEGGHTIAQRRAQHVFGEYNIADETGSITTRGSYVEIVGNGTASRRSNARTLDWEGNEVLSGNLTTKYLQCGTNTDSTMLYYVDNNGSSTYTISHKNDTFEFGNYGKGIKLLGNTTRPKYETPTTEDGGVEIALLSDIPNIPDTSKFLTTDTAQDVTGVKTYQSAPELYNKIPIYGTIGSGAGKSKYRLLEYYQTASNVHWVEVGSSLQLLNLVGNATRPRYSTKERNRGKDLALYSDIPDYFTTAGATGGNTSGGLKLTAGHLYRIYVSMGDAQLSCLVKMPNPMVEQYWFLGMNLYEHYCRLHISSAGLVTYQYANIGQNNWTDNNSVYITYEDITSKS